MGGRLLNFGGESFKIAGFVFGNIIFGDNFAGESVPEKDFLTGFVGGESLAARDDFCYFNHRGIITYLFTFWTKCVIIRIGCLQKNS